MVFVAAHSGNLHCKGTPLVLNNTGVFLLTASSFRGADLSGQTLRDFMGDGARLFILPARVCTLGSYIVPVHEVFEI